MNNIKEEASMNIGIVGCDQSATPIIDLIIHDALSQISFVYDNDPKAPGIELAKSRKILILDNLKDISSQQVDLVLNLTGSVETGLKIKKMLSADVELVGAKSAGLISTIIDERRKRFEEHQRVAAEREAFYLLGRHAEKIDNHKDAGFAIVDYGLSLSNMKAAALSLYDKAQGEMVVVASNGLEGFEENMRWTASECAATKKVVELKAPDPVSIDSLELERSKSRHFTDLGVKSVVSVPLLLRGQVHSVLYLCDFEEKTFIRGELASLSLLGVYCALIMEKVNILESMRHVVVSDALTGLSNKRYFMEQFEKEYLRSVRYKHNLSMAVFEIDGFNEYLDQYGHLEGNELLKEISAIVYKSVRSSDIAGRMSSGKFSALLCEIPKDGAFIFAQRLVERIANHPMPNKNMTVSAGISTYPADANGYMELMSKAEGNLHKAKEWGGNRTLS
ncbi:MAG: GGDEF domain-containing protein [Proteobacteria bacterium]|nr:GGDEF domain-containing protein [Pseudomonadota bacterium]